MLGSWSPIGLNVLSVGSSYTLHHLTISYRAGTEMQVMGHGLINPGLLNMKSVVATLG